MAKEIVLSNGRLNVGLDEYGLVTDFYYPYVGFENHCAGHDLRHRIGVWVDGSISWFEEDPSWQFTFRYPHSALIGHIIAKNERINVVLEFDDFVDASEDAFIRNIQVINSADHNREIRLFMHQAFAIGDSRTNTDTAQYIPGSEVILHYRGRRAFIIAGNHKGKPFDQFSVGLLGIEGHEGTFRDADDGCLSSNAAEHGRVDSVVGFNLQIAARSSDRVQYWIAAGTSMHKTLAVHKKIEEDGALEHMARTADMWHEWLEPAYTIIDKLEPKYRESFLQSIMIVKSQIDKRGAVIASTDSSLLNYSRDSYAYCWPRDGALALWPLIRMGYKDEAYRFFSFMERGMHSEEYLMHKYRADGAIGSSWHTYVHEGGEIAPPIQEDETAIVLFMFAQFYAMNPERSLLKEFYKSMVLPMANFLSSFVDKKTGLPRSTYNLWENSFLTTTYTTATVYAALIAASELATAAHDDNSAVKWRSSADDIQVAAHKYLYDEDKKVFLTGVRMRKGEIVYRNATIDCSSVFGAYTFGLFTLDEEEMRDSIETTLRTFGIDKGAPGLPRYENDDYRRSDPNISGNYWFITTLWLAQYYIDTDRKDAAHEILDWVKSKALHTGMMSEQFDPSRDSIVAPAPLAWTHAEYLSTLLDLVEAEKNANS